MPSPRRRSGRSRMGSHRRMRGSTEPKPSIKDRILGYFEEAAMDRGLLPQGVYLDGRTWKHGKPYTARTSKS